MNDIAFDLERLYFTTGEVNEVQKLVNDCCYEFNSLYQKAGEELSSFKGDGQRAVSKIQQNISELHSDISDIQSKKSSAAAKKKSPREMPPSPTVPSGATQQEQAQIAAEYRKKVAAVQNENKKIQEENNKIDRYIERCNNAISKLEDYISKLHRVEEALKREIERCAAKVNSFLTKAYNVSAYNSRVTSTMASFASAIDKVYEDARNLSEMSPSAVSGYGFVDRHFTIRNTHIARVAKPSSIFFTSTADEADTKTNESEEILIRSRVAEEFFDSIGCHEKIKMPSANLHKLGGKGFISKMNSLGYELSLQSDGSTMDISGMLHWEKKNV